MPISKATRDRMNLPMSSLDAMPRMQEMLDVAEERIDGQTDSSRLLPNDVERYRAIKASIEALKD